MKLGDAPGVHVKRTRIDMKILVTVILSIVGALLALAQGDSESTAGEAATPLEGLLDRGTLSERFQVIVDRNPFNLQPPPPPAPPKVEEEPEEEEISLKELNLILAGVSAKNGQKRAWLSMTLPPTQPEQDPVERFFGLGVGEQQNGVTIKSIESNGDVEILYSGTSELLTFESHGFKNKKKPKAKPKTKTNVRTTRTTGSKPTRTVTARTGSARNTSTRTSPSTGRATSGNRSAVNASNRTIPTRPVRTQPRPQLSREERIAIIETQRTIAAEQGIELPPLPPIR